MSDAPPPVRNLESAFAQVARPWSPHVLAAVNDHLVKVVRVQGEFVWHSHPGMDELFLVVDGALSIDLRDPVTGVEHAVELEGGDCFTVPADVPHRPRSAAGARVLLIEPEGMVSTGDFAGEVPAHIDRTTGRALPPG